MWKFIKPMDVWETMGGNHTFDSVEDIDAFKIQDEMGENLVEGVGNYK